MTLDDFLYYYYWMNPYWGNPEETVEKVEEFWKTDYIDKAPPVPGAKEALTKLKDMGYRLVVVTARQIRELDRSEAWLERNFPGLFETMICTGQSMETLVDQQELVTKLSKADVRTIAHSIPSFPSGRLLVNAHNATTANRYAGGNSALVASPARTTKRKRDDRSSSWLYSGSREDTVPPEGAMDDRVLVEVPAPKRRAALREVAALYFPSHTTTIFGGFKLDRDRAFLSSPAQTCAVYAETPSAATTSTQQPTQSTDDSGSQPAQLADDNLWGSLIPCSPILPQYKLYKSKTKYVIGRSSDCDIAISSRFISSHHCSIEWDGDTGPKSSVTVTDHSRYGTFLNKNRIEKAAILRDGYEIAFGTSKPRPKEGGIHDYRYIYRHLAFKPPSGGVHATYDMQHELGKGSYATVVKALHKQEGRWYAIKIISTHKLRGNWTDDAALEGLPKTDGARRLLREITVLERLKHKNICELKEVFVHSRNVYLVLELVPGGDLVRHLIQLENRGRRMSEEEARQITYQICDALAVSPFADLLSKSSVSRPSVRPQAWDCPSRSETRECASHKRQSARREGRRLRACKSDRYAHHAAHDLRDAHLPSAPEVVLRGSDGYGQIVDSWSVGMIALIMLTMDMQPVLGVNPKADLKTQVENRRVNWGLLRRNRVSEQGEDFIRSLLQDDPSKRMTLEDASGTPGWPTRTSPATVQHPQGNTPLVSVLPVHTLLSLASNSANTTLIASPAFLPLRPPAPFASDLLLSAAVYVTLCTPIPACRSPHHLRHTHACYGCLASLHSTVVVVA
ncbi:hypothetical protein NUW54_g5268 [Trametes sanguinea]|uniref:Uncharacterized protein n=1 Tax=Trametes sanguinea TaxID=158606 RepID=A0ACC1PX85_9APHY|nr:hypothetical protein NUW54_g5268 [Trametes sanguinea]